MSTGKRFAIASLGLVVVAAAIYYFGFVTPNKPTGSGEPFDIGMVTFAGYAPLYLAQEKGFFDGLDVKLHRIEDVANIRAGMTRGELEAYLATPDIALDTDTAPPGKAVWAIDESAGGDGVIVSGDIKDLAGLKGRKVAAEPGLPPSFILQYVLHQNGLSMKDIQFQDMTTQNAATAFVSDAVDAAGLYEPYLSTAKNKRKGSTVVLSSAQVPGLIVDLIFVRDNTITTRKADVEKVIAGWRRAVAYIREHPDESNEIMAKAFNLPVNEFKETVGGIRWLDLPENRRIFGTEETPGPLYKNFGVVGDVLRRNRSTVFNAKANDYLIRSFVLEAR